MDKILLPVLISFAVAIICGVILTIASRLFAVKEDEKFVQIRDCLPGANCGACGYSGCDGYAKALSDGKTDVTNACVPGGDTAAKEIAAVLGVKAEDIRNISGMWIWDWISRYRKTTFPMTIPPSRRWSGGGDMPICCSPTG